MSFMIDHRRAPVRAVGTVLLAAALTGVAGCGGGEEPDTETAGEATRSDAGAREATGDMTSPGLRAPSAEEVPGAFRAVVFEAEGPVLVFFHAPWHAGSQELLPVVREIGESRDGLRALLVNVDEEPAIAQAYRVPGVPTAAILRGGEPVSVLTEGVTAERLRSWVAESL